MAKDATARSIPPAPASGVVERVRRLRPDDAREVRRFYLDSGGVTNQRCYLASWLSNGNIRVGGASAGSDNDDRLEEFSRVSRTLLRCGETVALTLRYFYATESVLSPDQRRRLAPVGDLGGVMMMTAALERAWKNGITIGDGALATLRAVWDDRCGVRTVALYERVVVEAKTMLSTACACYEQNTEAAVRLRAFEQSLK